MYSTNNEVFIGLSNNGILSSSDNGQSWTNSNTGLNTLKITSFKSFGNNIFAGSKNNGIYTKVRDLTEPILENKFYSNNQITLRWTSSYKIHNYRFQLSYDSLFHNLIIDERNIFDTSYTLKNLDYNKVYYWRASSITKYWDDHFFEPQKIKTGSPNNYILYQNYPNPFNNQTIISFDVPNKSFIELNLFDVLGRKIKTLLNEQKEVGSHKHFLSNDNLASGVYILNLKSVGFSQSIKIVLLQ